MLNPSIPRSTTNPRISPFSSFAQTTAKSAKGAFEIHILAPFKITWSPASLKLVTIPAGLDPWSGSVKPKHPIHSPEANLGRYFFLCSSVPKV